MEFKDDKTWSENCALEFLSGKRVHTTQSTILTAQQVFQWQVKNTTTGPLGCCRGVPRARSAGPCLLRRPNTDLGSGLTPLAHVQPRICHWAVGQGFSVGPGRVRTTGAP